MAEPLALTNDGLPLRFAFLIELIDMLDSSPVCDVPYLTCSEEAVQHAAAGHQSNVTFMQRCHGPAAHPLLFAYKNAAGILHCHRALKRILNHIQR